MLRFLATIALATTLLAQSPRADRLKEMFAAVNAGDPARYARTYAPDAVIIMPGSENIQGRAAIEQYEVGLLQIFPGTRIALIAIWETGPLVVAHYGVSGKTSNGKAMGHEGLLFYRFDPNHLVAEERRYNDAFTPMAQLGAFGPGPTRPIPDLPSAPRIDLSTGSRTEAANIRIVKSAITALDAKNAEAFHNLFAAGATFDELILPGPIHEVEKWYDFWTTAIPTVASKISTIAATGDAVLVEMTVEGTLAKPLGRVQPSPKPFVVHRAAIVQLNHGKITRFAAFMNSKELATRP